MTPVARLHRRAVLKVALAAAGGAATAALAACGATGETPTPTPAAASPTRVPSATATVVSTAGATVAPTVAAPTATTGMTASPAPAMMASGGRTIPELRIGVPVLLQTFDPQETSVSTNYRLHDLTFDTLIRRDVANNSRLVPALATEWRRTDDRTLEVTLRSDVKWHDGTPFTAADVKYTFDRLVRDTKLEAASSSYFPPMSVEQLDDYRVRFVSATVDPVLEKRLASLGGQIIPAAYHQRVGTTAFRTRGVGTGPYRLVEFVPDERIVFEANDQYFLGAPAARRVVVRTIPEVATRVAALQRGEVEIITNLPPDQIVPLSNDRNIAVRGVPLTNINTLRSNMKVKPFDKREIRQAVSFVIDRKVLTEQLWGGNAIWTRGLQFEGEDYYDAARPQTPYDPDRAKQLLQQGGYAGEQIIYLASMPSVYTLEREVGETIMEMWRRVGINGKLEFAETAQKSRTFAGNKQHMMTASTGSINGDPDGAMWRAWGPDDAQQKNGWWTAESAAEFNRLRQEARLTLDRARRFDLYKQTLDVWEREAPGLLFYTPKESYGVRANIDWTPHPFYYIDLRPYNFRIK